MQFIIIYKLHFLFILRIFKSIKLYIETFKTIIQEIYGVFKGNRTISIICLINNANGPFFVPF